MPVIVLIGTAKKFLDQISKFFASKYEIISLTDEFKSVRSFLASQEPNKLYLVPNLVKPERYEIFCLCRKNQQQFVSLADSENDESTSSDKNIMVISEFNGQKLDNFIQESNIAQTTANKRSKSISLKSLGELKAVIKEVNGRYQKHGDISFILQECEDRIVKMWKSISGSSIEEAEQCYIKIVEKELKSKEFINK